MDQPERVGPLFFYPSTRQSPMPTPHKHAALIKQWADDPSQPLWVYSPRCEGWLGATLSDTDALPHFHYAIGPKPTQPPRKMCVLAGVEFPAPETTAPRYAYWTATPGGELFSLWTGDSIDRNRLKGGCIHLNREAAEQHSEALLAANKQAIEGAR